MARNREVTSNFIDIVKAIRISNNQTIEELADLAGVHRTTIGLLERHERTPTLQIANQIAEALNTPLHQLIEKAEHLTHNFPMDRYLMKKRNNGKIRNEDKLISITGLTGDNLLDAINSCYETLDSIDQQMTNKNSLPMAYLVELANLSSMVGNMVGGGIADNSNGLYLRNRPHAYPDLLPQRAPAVDLELKMALETNRPKGHLPKAGTYITFRYVLGSKDGTYQRGKEFRGDTVWIWEVKVGYLTEDDFSCSNTAGDSGKTAVVKSDVHNKMALVYLDSNFIPYAPRKDGSYVGFN